MTAIRRLLIANRGEIAVRVARTARAMGIATVAVYSDPDADAPHVRACDQAVAIGGATPGESYLRGEAIVAAARSIGADAVHPGYGFLSESAAFAARVQASELVWVGPHPDAIAAMGDKLAAKRRMAAAGVPVLPSVEVRDGTDATAAGEEVGYPLMVKAAAGGGGKGMRVVERPADLADAVAAARREAAGAFGDDRVFLERFVVRPRHVEVQILGDRHGTVVHLFERECSIQRRHQKVVEESPSPAVSPATRAAMGEAAVAAGRAIGYDNAGTVEFVVGEDGSFHFLEVNARLQVEHPVTEAVVRVDRGGVVEPIDLVRLQLLVAQGQPVPFAQDELRQVGHAIEARLYAEDPASGYLPVTGTLHGFAPETAGDVRWDTGVEAGTVVSPHYDPLLAKVIAHAPTRDEAAALLARALERSLVHGVTTNRDLLVAVLRHGAFLAGDTTTAFLERHFPADADRCFRPPEHAVRTAAIVAALGAQAERRAAARTQPTIPSGWRNSRSHDQRVRYRSDEREVEVRYRLDRDGTWHVAVDGTAATVRLHGPDEVEVDGRRVTARRSVHRDRVSGDVEVQVLLPEGTVTLAELPRFPRAGLVDVPGATLAPMPGSVVAVAVAEGQEVDVGDLLVTVEAMKMEHRVTAPHAGTVRELHVEAGAQVDAGQVLVVVEPRDGPPRDA